MGLWGLEFRRVWGFGVWGLGLRVWGLGFGVWGFRVWEVCNIGAVIIRIRFWDIL